MAILCRVFLIGLGCVYFLAGFDAHAAKFSTLASFPASDDGQYPYARPLVYGHAIYGTTDGGGRYFNGTIYKMDLATGAVETVYSFPGGAGAGPGQLVKVGRLFYGTTSGALYSNGTVFSFDPAAKTLTTIYSFSGSDGARPQGRLTDINGALYGTTMYGGANGDGAAYRIDLATGAETTLHSFAGGADGMYPSSTLERDGGYLYGTTELGGASANDGTLFRIDIATGTETVLYHFSGSDGALPGGAFVFSHGVLYGTTNDGGANGWGCVYAYRIKTGAETVLHSFSYDDNGFFPVGGLSEGSGLLYGTTLSGTGNVRGTIFSVDPKTGEIRTVYSFAPPSGNGGITPISPLLDIGGAFYGTTSSSGVGAGGSLYRFDPVSGTVTFLHGFTGVSAGQYANGSLLPLGDAFYGTTPQAGGAPLGGIFRLDPAKGKIKTLFSFTDAVAGYNPHAPLTLQNGLLYGTTLSGGSQQTSAGTAFSFDPSTQLLTTLFDFSGGAVAGGPNSALLYAGSALFGTSSGPNGGAVYSLTPGADAASTSGKTLTVFPTPSGTYVQPPPGGGLITAGNLAYGTSFRGGARGYGFIYSTDMSTGQTTTLYSFQDAADGANPAGGLVAVNGVFYGTTTTGGAGYNGTLFAFDPASGIVTILHVFDDYAGGCRPVATLLAVRNVLYGTGSAGASGYGTVFSYDIGAASYSVLYTFTGGADGGAPQAALVSRDGALYGTTSVGGAFNRGTAFKVAP